MKQEPIIQVLEELSTSVKRIEDAIVKSRLYSRKSPPDSESDKDASRKGQGRPLNRASRPV